MPNITQFTAEEERLAQVHLQSLIALREARKFRKFDSYFLASGPYRRELYAKHLRFFAAGGHHDPRSGECPPTCDGSPHRERAIFAGNRTGKTTSAAFECVCHATGLYPSWWTGARFTEPTLIWVANDSIRTTRDVNQLELLGPIHEIGTGMIPHELYEGDPTRKQGVAETIDSVRVKHTSGGISVIQFKSYEAGYEAFTGSKVHVIWLDEEPDALVYAECCIRTMSAGMFAGGLIMLTLTPLQGVTEVIKGYIDAVRVQEADSADIPVHS